MLLLPSLQSAWGQTSGCLNSGWGSFENPAPSSANAGSDLYNGLPRNGSYQIVQNVGQLGGGGYLNIQPHSGNYFFATHTSNTASDRVYYETVKVVPGQTYTFCAWATLLKNLGQGARYILGIYVNGQQLDTMRVNFGWGQMCGSYTVPAGVTSVELSIRDPKKGLFFAALDDICVTGPPAGNLRLGNQVWNDYDGDGKRDAKEPGIPSAPINLYTDNDGDNLPDGPAIRTTKTDIYGHYLFDYLPAGRYITSMPILPGYSPSPNTTTQATSPYPDNNVDNDNNLVRRDNGIMYSNAITLTAGAEPTNDGDDADGNMTMDLAECGNAWIGDFVWNDLNHNGIQDAGEPGINGVTVTITFQDGTTASTTTQTFGHDGYYDFKNLGPGTYKITFTTPAGYTPTVSNAGSNDSLDSDPVNGSVYVTIAANQSDFTIDAGYFQGTAAALSLGNLIWNDKNLNGVVDANEPGIANATVKLYKDDNNDDAADGAAIATTTTDANGMYRFDNLAPGNYIVGVIIPVGNVRGPNSSIDPDNDVDNDNNGAFLIGDNIPGSEVRSKAITLAAGTEPTNDGDDNNGNMTLDIPLCEPAPPPPPPSSNCPGTTNAAGYFGGFEAGADNFGVAAGRTDLSFGLPRNGSYEIVSNVGQAGGGGYLNIAPNSGNSFMLIHTSANPNDVLWGTTMDVQESSSYTFCAWIYNAKADPMNGFIVVLRANGNIIATATTTHGWTQICGTYTVPAGVSTVTFSIQDPNPGFGPSHFLALDDICISRDFARFVPQVAATPAKVSESIFGLQVYPNPATNFFTLKVNALMAGKAALSITDVTGAVVMTKKIDVKTGGNLLELIDISNIKSGVYNVCVKVNGHLFNHRLVVAK